jgi:hypothetical protein
MAQFSEREAERLDAVQAAELVGVIDLQARWENMRAGPAQADGGYSTPDLLGRQRTYEAFRSRLATYTARYKAAEMPETTLNSPERVAVWCRAVRAVFRRARFESGAESPTHAVEKAYRLADRIAARLKVEPVGRGSPPDGIGAVVGALDAVIQWCGGLVGPPVQLGTFHRACETAEPGARVA